MKQIVLSTVLALTLGTVSASAGMKFYSDANGQLFITPGEGRTLLNVSQEEVFSAMDAASKTTKKKAPIAEATVNEEIVALKEDVKELKKAKKDTPLFAKASKIKLSGTHYLGFNSKKVNGGDRTSNFEMRRNYVQVKAYVLDDSKSYFRVTLDSTYTNKTADGEGHADVYVKYAYLYLDEILPSTGVEFGMVHRPWIDYEEHQGWWMRSISKVFVEASEGAHLTNSADLGFNIKTKTPYFTSELGVFNGEGYHGSNDSTNSDLGEGVSAEWRVTAAMLGNGDVKRKPLKDSYFDASFFGQYNMQNSHNADNGKAADYVWYGVHSVYNTPEFLIAAQYVTSKNDQEDGGTGVTNWEGNGYSVNGTYRFGAKKQFSVIGRYDKWNNENSATRRLDNTEENIIYGLGWQQNKNFKWLLSGQSYDIKETDNKDYDSVLVTAEVHW